jgi:uncharacterized protein YecT (DUF1311 family)
MSKGEQMLKSFALLFALMALIIPARAQDGGGPEPQCDGNTREMVECLSGLTARWDQRLNDAYQKLLQNLGPKQKEQLRTAQRLWIQYRDANCLYYGLGEGTIARIEAGECMRSMTQSRALELEGKN